MPGAPAYVVAREAGELKQVRQGGVSALWDDHWCPSGVPGSCGTDFVRYRWVDPTATVRWCDEDTATFGQWGVAERRVDRAPERHLALGERPEQHDQLLLRRSARRDVPTRPRSLPPGRCPSTSTTCRCSAEPGFPCPFTAGGVLAIGGVVTDQSSHAYKGTSYKTIRAGIGWVRRAGASCGGNVVPSELFQTVMANVLGSTLGPDGRRQDRATRTT